VSTSHFVTGGSSFLGSKTDQDTYALSITLPIYQGGLTSARAREARSLAEQARQLLLDRQLTVSRDTRNLFRSVATDVIRVGARLKAIASSESALEATETGYEVGTRNIVDVLQAQNRLYSSQFDYADSRYNYVIDLMLLKQAAGTLADEDLGDLNGFADPNDPVTRLTSLRSRGGT
jgi:outer membrane protein